MQYVIKTKFGEQKYVYSGRVFVTSIGLARKFYTLTYARRFIKTHGLSETCEPIVCCEESKYPILK